MKKTIEQKVAKSAKTVGDRERVKILRREMKALKAALRDGEAKLVHAWHTVSTGVYRQAARRLELHRMAARLAELEG